MRKVWLLFVPNFLLLYLQIFLPSHDPCYYIPSNFSPSYPTYFNTNYLYQSTFLEDNLLTFLGLLFFTIDYFPTFLSPNFLPLYFYTFRLSYSPIFQPTFQLAYLLTFKLSKLSTSIILFSSLSSQFS